MNCCELLAVRWLQVFKRLFRVCRLVYIPGDWWTGLDASSRGTHGGRYAHETWARSQNRGQCECHEERGLERTSVICLMLLLLRAITWKANCVTCRLNFILWSFTCSLSLDNIYGAYHLSEVAGQTSPVFRRVPQLIKTFQPGHFIHTWYAMHGSNGFK